MRTLTKIIIGVLILALGIGLSLTQEQPAEKPAWVHEVKWQDVPEDAAKIEKLQWTEISPYRTEYDVVNINSSSGDDITLNVVATTKDSDNPDIYDFVYENNELLLTGYLLEAIPPVYRDEAIGIALENRDIAASVSGAGMPTVRRILPETSKRFYAPKTMLSVTWKGVSALVDPDERKVVQIWKAGGQTAPVDE